MNLKRGFFRLWLVTSLAFAALIGVLFFEDIRKEFSQAGLYFSHLGTLWVPVLCAEARGKDGIDYHRTPDAWANKICWYEESKFRQHYLEHKELSQAELSGKMYSLAGLPLDPTPAAWKLLFKAIGLAIGVPILLLLLGGLCGWIVAGFKNRDLP